MPLLFRETSQSPESFVASLNGVTGWTASLDGILNDLKELVEKKDHEIIVKQTGACARHHILQTFSNSYKPDSRGNLFKFKTYRTSCVDIVTNEL